MRARVSTWSRRGGEKRSDRRFAEKRRTTRQANETSRGGYDVARNGGGGGKQKGQGAKTEEEKESDYSRRSVLSHPAPARLEINTAPPRYPETLHYPRQRDGTPWTTSLSVETHSRDNRERRRYRRRAEKSTIYAKIARMFIVRSKGLAGLTFACEIGQKSRTDLRPHRRDAIAARSESRANVNS